MPPYDEVDRIVEAWGRERPDLDFAPLQVLSRVERLARHLDRARRSAFSASALESWEFDVLSALRRAGAPLPAEPQGPTAANPGVAGDDDQPNRPVGVPSAGRASHRPNDGRGILVVMTPAGQARVDDAISQLLVSEAELLDRLAPADS